MKSQFVSIASVALLIALAFAARSCGIWPFNGVVIAIENTGSMDYESCRIHVTGRTYDVGTLHVGEMRKTKVWPTGESHIELDLIDEYGLQRHLVVDCYLESQGHAGTISVKIGDGQIQDIVDDLGMGFP